MWKSLATGLIIGGSMALAVLLGRLVADHDLAIIVGYSIGVTSCFCVFVVRRVG